MKRLILTFAFLISAVLVFAQPQILKQTPFYKAYLDVPIVKKASLVSGKISMDIMTYLLQDTNPADIKYAVVNAVCMNGKKIDFVDRECFNLMNNRINGDLNLSSEMAIAYLTVMSCELDDLDGISHGLERAKTLEEINKSDVKQSKATSIIYGLIFAQEHMNENYCGGLGLGSDEMYQMWLLVRKGIIPLKEACFSKSAKIENDIRQNAIDIIWDNVKEFDE
ncbi:MAG: hypothetical protein IKO99_01105 [Bacteroidales bacterium]|nr:hypothetical protein [Bacteroidales bacterium]